MSWTAILDPSLLVDARDALRAIATSLATTSEPGVNSAERALFWAYARRVIDERFAHEAYARAVAALVDDVQRDDAQPSLSGGLAAHGWAMCHTSGAVADDTLSDVDERLSRLVDVTRWSGPCGLTRGLVGFGLYFLERIARGGGRAARAGLGHVVSHLAATAFMTPDGATWRTCTAQRPDVLAGEWRDGCFDVGIAHGVSGVVALLDRAARIETPPPGARALCQLAVGWIAGVRRTGPFDGSRFPARVGRPASWSHGDLGVAGALWTVAPCLARQTALGHARALDASAPDTPGLCHGAAGIAHLYNRCFQASGDAVFADAARHWIRRTVDMWSSHRDGGVPAASNGCEDDVVLGSSFASGSVGIGLALLAATTSVEPLWDRALFCDLPVNAARRSHDC